MRGKEPTSGDEIPGLCKQTFVSRTAGLTILWILAGLLMSMAGTAIGWAMTTEKVLTQTKADVSYIQNEQVKTNEQIIRKLDILIKTKE